MSGQGVRRLVAGALDRPGGRRLLSRLATAFVKRQTADDAEVFYDGVWIHRIGEHYLAVSPRFTFRRGGDFQRAYERQLGDARDFWFHAYEPQPGDTIVDVGAGIGAETYAFSRAVGPEGRVLAVEAHPDTVRVLRKHCEWNRLANVEVVHAAVVAAPGDVYVEDREEHAANAVHKDWRPGLRRVEGTTLDTLLERHDVGRVAFLKLNIEGAEVEALAGMSATIRRTGHVCIACHDGSRERVVPFLREHGFDIVTRDDDPRGYVREHVHGVRR